MKRSGKKEEVTFSFPSRFFPLAGLLTLSSTLGISLSLNRYFEHDVGGVYWPYISDTAKYPPEAAIFGFGMTLTSVWLAVVVTLNYGRVTREIQLNASLAEGLAELGQSAGWEGWKRNRLALLAGLGASPFLGLLAVFDTDRTPGLHLIFVLLFFPLMIVYVFLNTSVYSILEAHKRQRGKTNTQEYRLLKTSYHSKFIISCLLLFFVTLYLPVGMSLVTDWYNYRNDVVVHTFRAVMQHCSVFCLVLYIGSFWFDFGSLRMSVVQQNEKKED